MHIVSKQTQAAALTGEAVGACGRLPKAGPESRRWLARAGPGGAFRGPPGPHSGSLPGGRPRVWLHPCRYPLLPLHTCGRTPAPFPGGGGTPALVQTCDSERGSAWHCGPWPPTTLRNLVLISTCLSWVPGWPAECSPRLAPESQPLCPAPFLPPPLGHRTHRSSPLPCPPCGLSPWAKETEAPVLLPGCSLHLTSSLSPCRLSQPLCPLGHFHFQTIRPILEGPQARPTTTPRASLHNRPSPHPPQWEAPRDGEELVGGSRLPGAPWYGPFHVLPKVSRGVSALPTCTPSHTRPHQGGRAMGPVLILPR